MCFAINLADTVHMTLPNIYEKSSIEFKESVSLCTQ